MTFILKKYDVTVSGYGTASFFAKSISQARAKACRSLQSCNDRITFKDFLKMRPTVARVDAPEKFGEKIMVSGKQAHFVEHAGGNSIRFCYPDCDTTLISHELDVTFIQNLTERKQG